MSDWFDQLRTTLEAVGQRTRTWSAGDGRLLLLDHGARVVACALPGGEGNLFWHNPALASPDNAADVLEAAGGGIGGDRFWVGPEVAYMWHDLEAARRDPVGTYDLPAEMDPAGWQAVEEDTAGVVFGTEIDLTDHRTGRAVSLSATREIAAINAPADLPEGLRVASFSIRNDLALIEGDEGAVAGGWDLLQVPAGGTLFCPVVGEARMPRSYYADFGPRHVQVDNRCVRFLIDGQRRIKMGLSPEQTTGRMGYYRPLADGSASLIVRLFFPQPGEPYVDLPLDSNQTFGGDALQAYNDGGEYGGFGELEFHDPALVAGCGPTMRTGVSVTHILVGPDAAVREAGEAMLGVRIG